MSAKVKMCTMVYVMCTLHQAKGSGNVRYARCAL